MITANRPRLASNRVRAAFILATLLAACAPAGGISTLAGEIALQATPVPLIAGQPDVRNLGILTYLSGFVLSSSDGSFGGYSGLSIGPDGNELLAVSDFGHWLRARLFHDSEGRLIEVTRAEVTPMRDLSGAPLPNKQAGDAEALTRLADGSYLVAFEGHHRVWRYVAPDRRAETIPVPAAIARLPRNNGIEAMAPLGGNDLVLVSEGIANAAGDTRAWLRRDGHWSEFALASSDDYRPTDLARMPDGDLLLLERRFKIIGSVRARLSIIAAADIRPDARVAPREIAVLSSPMIVDNFEAVAVRRDESGRTIVYLLSADNQNPLQRTLLLQFELRR